MSCEVPPLRIRRTPRVGRPTPPRQHAEVWFDGPCRFNTVIAQKASARVLAAGHAGPHDATCNATRGGRLMAAVERATNEVSEYRAHLRALRAETEQLRGLLDGLRARSAANLLTPEVIRAAPQVGFDLVSASEVPSLLPTTDGTPDWAVAITQRLSAVEHLLRHEEGKTPRRLRRQSTGMMAHALSEHSNALMNHIRQMTDVKRGERKGCFSMCWHWCNDKGVRDVAIDAVDDKALAHTSTGPQEPRWSVASPEADAAAADWISLKRLSKPASSPVMDRR